MTKTIRWLCTRVAPLAFLPTMVLAQEPAIISGRVTDETATPIASATVAIPSMGLGATTRANGEYTIIVPGARVQNQPVALNVRVIGYKPQTVQVTLREGPLSQDFRLADNPLQLGEIVVTGEGTISQTEKLGAVRNNGWARCVTMSPARRSSAPTSPTSSRPSRPRRPT
jgi:TonB-dependent starch-binding outer membrane protein SusC